jgi:hypothetical protein
MCAPEAVLMGREAIDVILFAENISPLSCTIREQFFVPTSEILYFEAKECNKRSTTYKKGSIVIVW